MGHGRGFDVGCASGLVAAMIDDTDDDFGAQTVSRKGRNVGAEMNVQRYDFMLDGFDGLKRKVSPVGDYVTYEDYAALQAENAELRADVLKWTETAAEYYRELSTLRESHTALIDLAEFWINREDTRDYSEGAYRTWLELGHRSKTLRRAKELLPIPKPPEDSSDE